MPQELELVYNVETGEPAYMHSVDAAEAIRLGDYVANPPSGKDPTPEARARAMAAVRGMNSPVHAELQSPEERAERRRVANEAAAAALAPPVVVMAPAPAAAPEPAARMSHPAPARHVADEKK
jgi:hypothetical protein